MYALTKVYKSEAQAINAIRMTARNKQWAVLDTEAAKAHVQHDATGYTVNNETLNIALGFVTAEPVAEVAQTLQQRVPAGAVTTDAQLTARTVVIPSYVQAIVMPVSAQTKTKKSRAQNATESKQTRSIVQNNARRPARAGKTLDVWLTSERLYAELGRVPELAEVYGALCAQYSNFNKTTCSIQFYACRKFHNWESARKAHKE